MLSCLILKYPGLNFFRERRAFWGLEIVSAWANVKVASRETYGVIPCDAFRNLRKTSQFFRPDQRFLFDAWPPVL